MFFLLGWLNIAFINTRYIHFTHITVQKENFDRNLYLANGIQNTCYAHLLLTVGKICLLLRYQNNLPRHLTKFYEYFLPVGRVLIF